MPYTEFTFAQTVMVIGLGITGLIGTILAVRIGISLNLVEYLKYRKETQRRRLQNICPHFTVVRIADPDGFGIESYFHSPYGTTDHICSRCQLVVSSRDHLLRLQNIWINDPEGLMEREEKFDKEIAKYFKI